jgi:galactokinase
LTGMAERAAKVYAERYGGQPAGVWAAPGRVNLIGEHTDYNEGFVLPFALPQLTAVAATRLDEPSWVVYSEVAGEEALFGSERLSPGDVTGWAAYVAGVVWALREAGCRPPGAHLAIASDVPLGAGLSSSAALECAVLTALADLGDLAVSVADQPRIAQHAENDFVGMPCGIMDQSAATLCREGHALFLDCRTQAAEQIPFDIAARDLAILVIDTQAPHRHVSGDYAARRHACEEAVRQLGVRALRDVDVDDLPSVMGRLSTAELRRRVRHVVTENQRVLDTVALLRGGDVKAIGPLMTASHASLRDDYEVTVPELDTAVESALAAGAYGARMTGGGFGGCALALVDTSSADPVAGAVARAFGRAGFGPPRSFVAVPSAGARRIA